MTSINFRTLIEGALVVMLLGAFMMIRFQSQENSDLQRSLAIAQRRSTIGVEEESTVLAATNESEMADAESVLATEQARGQASTDELLTQIAIADARYASAHDAANSAIQQQSFAEATRTGLTTQIAALEAQATQQAHVQVADWLSDTLQTREFRMTLPGEYLIFDMDEDRDQIAAAIRGIGSQYEPLAFDMARLDGIQPIRYVGVDLSTSDEEQIEFFVLAIGPLLPETSLEAMLRSNGNSQAEREMVTLGSIEALRTIAPSGEVSYLFLAGKQTWGITFVSTDEDLQNRIGAFDTSLETFQLLN